MICRMLGLLVIFAIFASASQAGPIQQNSLKTIFDELNYSLSVEWDQKDKNYYSKTIKKFEADILQLKTQGLSNQDFIRFLEAQSNNTKLNLEIRSLMSDVAFKLLPINQQRRVITKAIQNAYPKGANWAGARVEVIVVTVFVAMIAVLLLTNGNGGDGSYEGSGNSQSCNQWDQEICNPVYDEWGYYEGEICHWTSGC